MNESIETLELRGKVKKVRKNGNKVEEVFHKTMNQIANGETVSISQNMRDAGYSNSSAHALKVTRTRTWQELKEGLPKDKIFKVFDDLIDPDNTDKRTRLAAAIELCKLYDFYPGKKIKYEEINNATNRFFEE